MKIGAALFLFCLLLGGGGVEGLAQSALVEGLAVLACFILAASILSQADVRSVKRAVLVIAVGLVLLALQLVPLPPDMWHSFPGRETPLEVLRLVGQAGSWRPLSLNPGATIRFLVAFSVPIAVFLWLALSGSRALRPCLAVLVGAAILSAAIGILQIALDYPAFLTWFDAPSPGAGSGLFANPNHHATFLSVAMIAAALLTSLESARQGAKGIGIAVILFLALGVISTGARAGIALLLFVVPACALLIWRTRGLVRPLLALGVFSIAFALVAVFYPETNRLALRESFSFADDGRALFLPDLTYVAKLFWPVGSGFGTFVQVFAANEDLDRLDLSFVNHAHNEIFEWIIEGGLLGLIVVAFLAIAILVAWRRRLKDANPLIPMAGGLMLVVLIVHSLFDYPLRTDTMAACAGLALALATVPFSKSSADQESHGVAASRRALFAVAVLVGLGAGAWASTLRLAQWADRSRSPALALRLDPGYAPALARQSRALLASHPQRSASLAKRAVVANPMLQSAVSALAATRKGAEADASWAVSAKLGWRDLETQWWAMRQAVINNEDRIAAERADALLRSARTNLRFTSIVRSLLEKPAFRQQLAKRLEFDPPWRASLFSLSSKASDTEREGLLAFALELRRTGQLRDDDLRGLVADAVGNKNYQKAWQIVRLGPSRSGQSGLVHDPDFDRDAKAYRTSLGFDWVVSGSGASSGTVESGILIIDTDGQVRGRVARQVIRLPRGEFRLVANIAMSPQSDDAFALSLECLGPSAPIASLPLTSDDRSVAKVDFSSDGRCPFAMLSLETLSGGRPDHLELQKVDIRPAN